MWFCLSIQKLSWKATGANLSIDTSVDVVRSSGRPSVPSGETYEVVFSQAKSPSPYLFLQYFRSDQFCGKVFDSGPFLCVDLLFLINALSLNNAH